MIGTLTEALEENRSRQAKLKETIDSLEHGRPMKKPAQNPVIARNPVTVFYAPYFKDADLYTHPPNMETLAILQEAEAFPGNEPEGIENKETISWM